MLPQRRAPHNGANPAAADHVDANARLVATVEALLADVPAPRTRAVADPATAADQVARQAARQAGVVSGSLALPPGPIGLVTVLPDLYLIWKLQRQMVADIFALHDRSAELGARHMLHCLFRHLASQVVRDVGVRAGERLVLATVTSHTVRNTAAALSTHLARRIAGAAAGRWVPLAGAAAVGAYAYWDTLQVAKAARRLLAELDTPTHGGGRAAASRYTGDA
ncbi:MAG: hypothetical protein ABIS17_06305 [Casimicrobiaceae bacterium]